MATYPVHVLPFDSFCLILEKRTSLMAEPAEYALQRHNTENSKQIFPEKKIAQPQSQFPHSCVFERFIFSRNRSAYILLQEYMWTDLGNIQKSITDT